ncbi:MAG: ion transporter [Cyanobacteria bacterium P01_E01_bin.6]
MPGRFLNLAIAALVLLSSLIFIAETYPLDEQIRTILNGVNTIILIIFAIEYGLRFWSANHKLRYLISPYSLIDLIAILPFFIGVLDISFVLIFRWFRILRLFRFIKGQTILGYVSSEDATILTRIFFTLFAIVFVYSGLIYQVEHPVNGDEFNTFLDALYFAVATMTTVGFGDITPISELGRLLTILMIWSGITLIPWQIGDLVKRLLKTLRQVETPCPVCKTEFHDSDAKFCRVCGSSLHPMPTVSGDRP